MTSKYQQLSDRWRIPAEAGFSMLPVRAGRKEPVGGWKRFQRAHPTVEELLEWQRHNHNVGIVTGEQSDIIVLDLDSLKAIAEAEARGLPKTPSAETPRGRHEFYRHPRFPVGNKVSIFHGADVRGDGGYVVGPGSTFSPTDREFAAGKLQGTYRWRVSPEEQEIAEAPEWLLDLLRPSPGCGMPFARGPSPHLGDVATLIEAVRNAEKGTRNDTLNISAFFLAKLCCADETLNVVDLKSDLAQAAVDAGLPLKEVEATLTSGWDAGVKQAEFDATEDGVALQFTRTVGVDFLFDGKSKRWHHWTGTLWEPNAASKAKAEIRIIARRCSKPSLRKASAIEGAERLARTDPAHWPIGDWDANPFLLGTPGGVIELQSGVLRSGRREDLITKLTSVAPLEGEPRLWMSFLREATGGDEQMITFLQRLCGYLLTGDTREQCLIFVYGPGGNGKSVFINVVRGILHDYAVTAATEVFTATAMDRHTTDLAMMAGARLVSASETEHGKAWAEARIKQLTGGDPVTARFMHCDNFTYMPLFKLVIVGNHHPELRHIDDALKRRILIAPFLLKPSSPDAALGEKLRSEYPQILAWMIEGCRQWIAHSLQAPPAVRIATNRYFEDQDTFKQWLEDGCDLGAGLRSTPAELFASWVSYCSSMSQSAGTQRSFVDELGRREFVRGKSNGIRYWLGIRPKPEGFDDQGS